MRPSAWGIVDRMNRIDLVRRDKGNREARWTAMATKPYPSNIIIFNVDDRILDDDLKLALKRSWTHIGEMLVRPHAASEGSEPRNIMHVVVKYGTRSYLRSGDEERDANWSERMEQHLLSTMRKISNNNIAFNRRQRKTGDAELAIDAIEFELEAGALTLEYRLDSNGCVPASCAHIATDIRAALNAGVLGEPVRVKAPSDSSYRRQAHAYAQLKAEEAARAAVEEETRLAAERRLAAGRGRRAIRGIPRACRGGRAGRGRGGAQNQPPGSAPVDRRGMGGGVRRPRRRLRDRLPPVGSGVRRRLLPRVRPLRAAVRLVKVHAL